jgi:DNA-directed RNA polymerase subunit RPC12/RpoP
MGSARLDIEDFKTKAAEIHKGKYDYSKVLSIKNNREKVLIICPIHGEFPQTPHNHLSGQGCPYCSPWSMPKTKENFIKEAREIHGYKYDYTYVEYKRLTNKVKIVCKKCGNIFEQSASSHLAGAGCPHCIQSRGETRVRLTLDKLRVKYEEQKIFQTPIAPGQKHLFRVDFFVPGKNLIIEYNGEQHYIARRIVTKKSLERQQKRDEALRRFCKEANIDLLEIPYTDFKNIDSILYKKIRAHV